MQLQRHSNQKIMTFDPAQKIGGGGEGVIYAAQDRKLAAKVYHNPTPEQERKLLVMFQNPPQDPMRAHRHASIAWPADLLRTVGDQGRVVGFLMPRVADTLPVIDLYVPKTRLEKCPLFNHQYLHHTGRNVAAAIAALHASGYVVGDINESNILVTASALVTLVDTDSFQAPDPKTGRLYRCTVGKPEFTPPEIQGKNFRDIDRVVAHDLFGLAVLIFQLLMEGTHPFSGPYTGAGDPPSTEARIKAGHFPYGTRTIPYKPAPIAPDLQILHPELQQLFRRCFEDGHRDSRQRPSALEWQEGLDRAERALRSCSRNGQHRYGRHLRSCPWCRRAADLGGRDYFPSEKTLRQGHNPASSPPKQTPLPPVKSPRKAVSRPTPRPTPVRSPARPLSARFKAVWLQGKTWAQGRLGLYVGLCALGGGLSMAALRGGLAVAPGLNRWFVSVTAFESRSDLKTLSASGALGALIAFGAWTGVRRFRRP